MEDKKFTNEVLESIGELNPKKVGRATPPQYKLGQEIANGVRYWGQDKIVKDNRTSICICPACGNVWRVRVSFILSGDTKSCCRAFAGKSRTVKN